jgi:hypothetical protein
MREWVIASGDDGNKDAVREETKAPRAQPPGVLERDAARLRFQKRESIVFTMASKPVELRGVLDQDRLAQGTFRRPNG